VPSTVGVPKEIKDQEGRVALQPDGAAELSHHGHRVLIEKDAGLASGFKNEEYERAGAEVVASKQLF
jgi:alanine dehydrogenase